MATYYHGKREMPNQTQSTNNIAGIVIKQEEPEKNKLSQSNNHAVKQKPC